MDNKEIINYYNDCKKDYQLIWRLDRAWGLHYGYFDENDKSLTQAILKMNEQIIKHTSINENSKVLDAGCGYGGTAIYIAEKKKCHIEAITIVEEQVKTAKEVIKEKKLDKLINVSNQDYTNTKFKDNTFDVVYGIESICHGNKKEFLKEAYRILKDNGILIIFDGYNSKEKEEYSKKELKYLKNWNNGWAVESLETSNFFIEESKKLGFINQEYTNISDKVLKTSKILYYSSFPAVLVNFLRQIVGKSSKYNKGNVKAARYQFICMKKNLWEYGIFKAIRKENHNEK